MGTWRVIALIAVSSLMAADSLGIRLAGSIALPVECTAVAFEPLNGKPYVVVGGADGRLSLLDVRDAARPRINATYDIVDGVIRDLAPTPGFIHVAAGPAGYYQFDIRTQGAFLLSGQIRYIGDANSIALPDVASAVMNHYPHVSVVDLRALQPSLQGSVEVFGHQSSIAVRGDYGYLTKKRSIVVVDISDGASPSTVATVDMPDTARCVEVCGDLLCVGMAGRRIGVYGIAAGAELGSPGEIAPTFGDILATATDGDCLYVTGGPASYLEVYDLAAGAPGAASAYYRRTEGAFGAVAAHGSSIYVCADDTLLVLERTNTQGVDRRPPAKAMRRKAGMCVTTTVHGRVVPRSSHAAPGVYMTANRYGSAAGVHVSRKGGGGK